MTPSEKLVQAQRLSVEAQQDCSVTVSALQAKIAELSASLQARLSFLEERMGSQKGEANEIEALKSVYAALTSRVAEASNRLSALENQGRKVKLLFSDLTHAPKSGWSAIMPNRGAAISIWARDFGGVRGSSFVTVNRVELKSDADYAEWNVDSYDVPFLKRTTFWINSLCHDGPGSISVTINGVKSNELPFTVIAGRILFVAKGAALGGNGSHEQPWHSPSSGWKIGLRALRPGDVMYIRQGATPWTEKYMGGRQNLYIDSTVQNGTENAPIAIAAYPGESPIFDATGTADVSGAISCYASWFTISKFRLRSIAECMGGFSWVGLRIIGNDCVGCRDITNAAPIFTYGSKGNVLGNSVHGITSGNKQDHAIYLSGNASTDLGIEVAYNHIYNNNVANGSLIVVNHQQDRIPVGQWCKQHRIHHNFVDMTNFGGRGIGIYSQSYQPNEQPNEHLPEPTLVHDNLIVGSSSSAMYMNEGIVEWRDNVLIKCKGTGIFIGYNNVHSFVAEGNIVYMDSGVYIEIMPGIPGSTVVKNNAWLGMGAPPSADVSPVPGELVKIQRYYYQEWLERI